MVRLSRAYSIASFLGIAIVAVALSWFYRNRAVDALVQYQTLSNVELTRAIANAIWPRYADFITNADRIQIEHLATQPEVARLRSELERKLYDVNVAKVQIYNMYGLTVFSTERRQIGENRSDNPGFHRRGTAGSRASSCSATSSPHGKPRSSGATCSRRTCRSGRPTTGRWKAFSRSMWT